MLSDSERASSITAPAPPVSGADCGGKERVRRDRGEEERRRAPQEGNFQKRRRGRNKERGEEYSPCTHRPTGATGSSIYIHSSLHPLFSPIPAFPFPINSPSFIFELSSASRPSILPSLHHGQLATELIGHGVSRAAAGASAAEQPLTGSLI